jgi:hypothetical protein
MSIEKENKIDKLAEGKETNDCAGKLNTIKSASDNGQNQRLKLQDSLKSFKLTSDGQASFTIDMGDGSAIKDLRAKRIEDKAPLELVDYQNDSASKRHDVGSVRELLAAKDGVIPAKSDAPRDPDKADKDYTHKGTPTKAPDSVTVIVAEGTPGKLWKPKGDVAVDPMKTQLLDYFDAIDDKTFNHDIAEAQKKDVSKKVEPRLIYINACYSGEGNSHSHIPDGSVASRIASEQKSYVLGNIGLGNGAFPDQTFPDTEPYPTPLGERHGNPFLRSKVRLFGPDGKPVPGGEFETPVDWKLVQKKINELEQAKQKKSNS